MVFFFLFINNESYDEATYSSKRLDILETRTGSPKSPKLGYLLWKVYSPSKYAEFGAVSFDLCETKSGYVWNLCFGQYTVFNGSLWLLAPLLNHGYRVIMNNRFEAQICSINCTANRLMLCKPCIKTGRMSLLKSST
jgi:hypothetical protein